MLHSIKSPIIGPYIPIILSAIFGYSGLKIMGSRKGPEMYNNYVQQWSGEGPKKNQVVLKCSLLINLIKLRAHQNY